MDIAFVIPKLDKIGGAEKYFYKIVKYFKRKHKVTVYALKFNPINFPELKSVVKVIDASPKLGDDKLSTILEVFAVTNMGKRIPMNHDLYNFHIFPTNFIDRKPNVWTAQEPPRMLYDLYQETLDELNFFERMIARIYFKILRCWDAKKTKKNVQKMIVNSNHSKKYIDGLYNKDSQVIYPGIDERLLKIKKKVDENLLITVGRLYGVKRVDLILKAFKLILKKKPEMRLAVIGEGPEKSNLIRLSEELGIINGVIFTGEVSEKELIEYYSKAKLTIYMPKREMFGIVPMESIASGTPVIGVNEGGFTEIIGTAAKLVKPTPTAISKAVVKLLENKKLYKEMSKKGRMIAKNYTWKETAKRNEEMFKTILKQS